MISLPMAAPMRTVNFSAYSSNFLSMSILSHFAINLTKMVLSKRPISHENQRISLFKYFPRVYPSVNFLLRLLCATGCTRIFAYQGSLREG